MPRPLIIALGVIVWAALCLGLSLFVGGAARVGDEVEAEVGRELAEEREDRC